MVECLTGDRGVAGSSLTRGTALSPGARHRVPTSTGKPGKSQKKVPCMEKSWNLKKNEKSWKIMEFCEILFVFDCLFSGYW